MCRSVCPVLEAELSEASSPRGKIALCEAFVEERLGASPELLRLLSRCTGCRSCSLNCTSGTDPRSAAALVRSMLPASEGKRPRRGPSAEMVLRISGSRHKDLKDLRSRAVSGRRRVAYFVGCVEKERFPSAVSNTLRLLGSLGIHVSVPDGQECCGWPKMMIGDFEGARRLARANAKAFENSEVVLATCPHCRTMLREDYSILMGSSPFKQRTTGFLHLVSEMGLLDKISLASCGPAVSYARPCRTGRGRARESLTLDFLREHLGDSLVPYGRDMCCGAPLEFTDPELARRILKATSRQARLSEASRVLSDCPFCLIALEQASGVSARHLLGDIITSE